MAATYSFHADPSLIINGKSVTRLTYGRIPVLTLFDHIYGLSVGNICKHIYGNCMTTSAYHAFPCMQDETILWQLGCLSHYIWLVQHFSARSPIGPWQLPPRRQITAGPQQFTHIHNYCTHGPHVGTWQLVSLPALQYKCVLQCTSTFPPIHTDLGGQHDMIENIYTICSHIAQCSWHTLLVCVPRVTGGYTLTNLFIP